MQSCLDGANGKLVTKIPKHLGPGSSRMADTIRAKVNYAFALCEDKGGNQRAVVQRIEELLI